MEQERIHPPPRPSTPKRAPWEELREITKRLDRLISIWEARAPAPGMPPVIIPGVPVPPGVPRVPGVPGVPGVPAVTRPPAVIPFYKEIATAYQDEQIRNVTFKGIVYEVLMGFPSGCQHLVEVRLFYSKNGSESYIVPSIDESYIKLDDFTTVFRPMYPVDSPGKLTVEWYNYDSDNVHSVPVIVTLYPTE